LRRRHLHGIRGCPETIFYAGADEMAEALGIFYPAVTAKIGHTVCYSSVSQDVFIFATREIKMERFEKP
jgi:hypothetical protein